MSAFGGKADIGQPRPSISGAFTAITVRSSAAISRLSSVHIHQRKPGPKPFSVLDGAGSARSLTAPKFAAGTLFSKTKPRIRKCLPLQLPFAIQCKSRCRHALVRPLSPIQYGHHRCDSNALAQRRFLRRTARHSIVRTPRPRLFPSGEGEFIGRYRSMAGRALRAAEECPLSGVKRTWRRHSSISDNGETALSFSSRRRARLRSSA